MDGHLLKLSAVTATLEGCCFDSGPRADNSAHVQSKAGGNVAIRGCVFVGSRYTQNEGQGHIIMTREYSGSNPNFEWWAGLEGNSLTVEQNVFVSHYGKPLVFFFPAGAPTTGYMAPGSGVDQIASVTVRDNIGMVASTPTTDSPFSEAKWIKNDPTGGAAWVARGNSVMTYGGPDEVGFSDDERRLKTYRRLYGAIAGGGAWAPYRFVFPHGYIARTDSNRGLG